MREAVGVDNDVQLANKLNLKPNSITSWKTQGTIPYKQIDLLSGITNRPFEWFLEGEYPEGVSEPITDPYIVNVIKMMKPMDEDTKKRVDGDVQDKKLMMDLKKQLEEKKTG